MTTLTKENSKGQSKNKANNNNAENNTPSTITMLDQTPGMKLVKEYE